MKEKGFIKVRIVVVLAAFICIFFSVDKCSDNISRELVSQTNNSMRFVAEQNRKSLEREIMSEYDFLRVTSYSLSGKPEAAAELIQQLSAVTDVYNIKRIGYIDSSGMCITTDGYKKDLSYREFFRKGMKGEVNVTSSIDDTIGQTEKINVLSIPVYESDNSTVQGVFFATYTSENYRNALDFESFDGEGRNCIIDKNGNVIAASPHSTLENAENLFEKLEESSSDNKSAIQDIKKSISNNDESGNGSFYLGDKQLFYLEPVNMFDGDIQWYVVMTVPEDYIKGLEEPLHGYINQLVFILGVVLVISISIFIYFHRNRQKELKKYIYEDPLTNGGSFAAFCKKFAQRKVNSGYIVSLDLSDFKVINSTCGVKKGDIVIKRMWDIISAGLKKDEFAAHINADYFVIFMYESERSRVAERISHMGFEISDLAIELNAPHIVPAFGVYCVTESDKTQETQKVLGKANMAKKVIKGRHDRCYAFYDELDMDKIEEQRIIEDDFYKSLRQKRFELWYQPKFGNKGMDVVGAEVLVRWKNKAGEVISPGKFIPYFEKNGMISKLDEYIFENACRQQKEWKEEGKKRIPVSVNISRSSLYYADIVDRYIKILNKYGLDTSYIQLEITESAVIDNKEATSLIQGFKKHGFKILIDDFGHGYSSIAMLNSAQFDVIKLDKSLIDAIGKQTGNILLDHLIVLAHELGMSVTAEGVESKEQADFIWSLGCNDIQGYYYSKPLNRNDYEKYL